LAHLPLESEIKENMVAAHIAASGLDTMTEQQKAYEEEECKIRNTTLCIPIRSSASFTNRNDFVEIFMDEISDIDSGTITSILRDEDAPLSVWTETALMYMRAKKSSDSLTLLTTACNELLEQQNLGSREEKVRLLAASGIGYLTRALASTAEANRNNTNSDELSTGMFGSYSRRGGKDDTGEEFRNFADTLFTRASKVDNLFPMTWIGRGMLNLSMDRVDQAIFFFKTTLDHCGQVLPALIGMACVKFKEENYQESMEIYESAIRYFPQRSGAAARVGFGLACYKVGQIDRAKAAFIRAHEIDNTNVEAMIGIAVLEMASLDKKLSKNYTPRTENAIQLLSQANLIDHSNAMVQNHLANHYFWKWTPVTGVTVEVEHGSNVVKATSELNLDARGGERIRIGLDFETITAEDEEEDDYHLGIGQTSFKIQDAWKSNSAKGLQVWKKDYDRVITLAKSAYSSTSIKEIQAESLFLLARVYHVKEDMEMAHKFYKQACKLAPDLSPARFGWAQTLIWDEKYEEAAINLGIVIGNSSSATDAYAALGLLEVRAGLDKKKAFSNLSKAIDMDPLNPDLVLVEALALQQQESDYPEALKRYRKAVELMEMRGEQVPWDVLTNMGVLCHETNNYDEAGKCYERALYSLDADDEDDDHERATESSLEVNVDKIRHIDNRPFWAFVDTKVNLSYTSYSNSEDEGLVFEMSRPEPNLIVGDHVRIEEDFESIIRDISGTILTLKDKFVSLPETTNDLVDENQKQGGKLQLYVKRANGRLAKSSTISVAFNLARLHEEAGRIIPAVELHKAIIQRHPSYVNSYLRLACISRDCGSLDHCSQWLKSACKIAPGNPEVLALVGNLHLSLSDWARAQKIFDQLLQQSVPNVEAYSMLCLGNIYFNNLKTPERYDKHLNYASDWYKRILNKDTANAYAANGLGTILAEKGELAKARDIFTRVREISGDTIPDCLLNLGHLHLALSKHPEALQMYQQYMNRTKKVVISDTENNGDVVVLSYIAFAYFDWAKQTEKINNAKAAPADERYKKCIEYLELAMKCSKKENLVLRFNWCMTKLQSAHCVLQKLTRNIRRTAKEVQDALDGLQESLPKVQTMIQWKQENKKVPIPTSTLNDFVEQCRENIESAKSHLSQELKKEAELEEIRELQKIETLQRKKEYELEKLKKKHEESEFQKMREERAKMKMEKVSNLLNGWKQEERAKEIAVKKKTKENTIPEALGSNEVEVTSPATEDPSALSDEENVENGVKLSTQTQRDLFGDDENTDDDSNDKNNQPVDTKTQEKAPLEKELFDDSSSDESEAGSISAKRKIMAVEEDAQLAKKAKVIEGI